MIERDLKMDGWTQCLVITHLFSASTFRLIADAVMKLQQARRGRMQLKVNLTVGLEFASPSVKLLSTLGKNGFPFSGSENDSLVLLFCIDGQRHLWAVLMVSLIGCGLQQKE